MNVTRKQMFLCDIIKKGVQEISSKGKQIDFKFKSHDES